MTSDHGDLSTLPRIGERRRELLEYSALASRTRPLLRVVLLEIACVGHWVVREVAPHARQAPSPHPQGVMRASKARLRPIVKASRAGLAQGALTLGWRVIPSLLGHSKTITMGTSDTLWPVEGADSLKTLGVIEERLSGYHDTSIAQGARWNKRSGQEESS